MKRGDGTAKGTFAGEFLLPGKGREMAGTGEKVNQRKGKGTLRTPHVDRGKGLCWDGRERVGKGVDFYEPSEKMQC